MDKNLPEISIIIATYNSENKLLPVLESIKKQSYPRSKIEILLVDGGSKDGTLKLGKKYSCTIINNPRTEPVYAKLLGYKKAQGRYAMYLDHDEVMANKNSLGQKIYIFQKHNVKTVISSGYKNPEGYSFLNEYINEFGDPFTYFIYRISKSYKFLISSFMNKYPKLYEDNSTLILDIKNNLNTPIVELVAGGTMIDLPYFKKTFPETLKKFQLMPHLFYLLREKDTRLAISKNDYLIHYSSENLKSSFNKIKWRINNNIQYLNLMGSAGYSGREKYQNKSLKFKKYLFIPYALSIVLPLIDALLLAISRKKVAYFFHVVLTLYTAVMILYYYSIKLFGIKTNLRNYDNSVVISKKRL